MTPQIKVIRKQIYVNGEKLEMIRGRSGGYRLIGIWDDKIVKCDYKCDNWGDICDHQTKSEILFYDKILPQDQQFFPKPICHGKYKKKRTEYHFLIQEKVDHDPDATMTYKNKRILQTIIRRYKIYDISVTPTGETPDKYDNFFITPNDSIVIFDFGMNGKC